MQWSYCSLVLSHGFDCFKQPSAHRHLLKINHLACSKERLKTRSILIYSELKNDSVDDNNIIVWQERSNDAIKGTGTKINMFGCCKLVLYSKLWQKWQCWWQQYVLCGRKDQVTATGTKINMLHSCKWFLYQHCWWYHLTPTYQHVLFYKNERNRIFLS